MIKMIFAILSLSPALAMSASAIKAVNPTSCPKDSNDPFSIQAEMSSGPYRGLCIDTNVYRTTKRISKQEVQNFLSPEETSELTHLGIDLNSENLEFMANFTDADSQNNEHFYVAIFPVERVQSAVIQVTRLSKKAPVDHGQIRLRLSKDGRPVVLIDQVVSPQQGRREMRILNDDIILTVSGVRPIGHPEPYSPIKGLVPGHYDEEFQIGSMQDLTYNWIRSEGYSTKEYLLNFNSEQAQNLLRTGIDYGTESGITKPYSTLTSSCWNISFIIMKRVLNIFDNSLPRRLEESVRPMSALVHFGVINKDKASSYIDELR